MKYNLPMRHVLEWYNFKKKKPSKREGMCLFSDGVIHRVGWWSVSEGKLFVPNGDGTNSIIDHDKVLIWASIGNLVSFIDEGFDFAKRVEGGKS